MKDQELKDLFQKVRQYDQLQQASFEDLVADEDKSMPLISSRWRWIGIAASFLLLISIASTIWIQTNRHQAIIAEETPSVPLNSDVFNYSGSSLSDWEAPSEFSNPNDNTTLTNWESPTNFLLTLD